MAKSSGGGGRSGRGGGGGGSLASTARSVLNTRIELGLERQSLVSQLDRTPSLQRGPLRARLDIVESRLATANREWADIRQQNPTLANQISRSVRN